MLAKAVRVWRYAKKQLKKNPSKEYLKEDIEYLPAALEVLERPASPIGRIIPLSICTVFVIALVWAYIGKLDVVAVAQGHLVPLGKTKTIKPFESGVIQTIAVQEGEHVNQGDILFELNKDEVLAELNELKLHTDLTAHKLQRINNQLSFLRGQDLSKFDDYEYSPIASEQQSLQQLAIENYQIEFLKRERQITNSLDTLRLKKADLKLNESNYPIDKRKHENKAALYEQGMINDDEWLASVKENNQLDHRIFSLKESIRKLEKDIANQKTEQQEYRHSLIYQLEQERLTELELLEDSAIKQTKLDIQIGYLTITSPASGYVQSITPTISGDIVSSGEELLQLVPDNVDLFVEANIQNKDIGFIEEGSEAIVKFSALPYTKYGYIKGTVANISYDSVEDESTGERLFPAVIHIEKQFISTIDREIPLKAGMDLTAEIKLDDRRIIDYFTSTFKKYQSETLREH